MMLRKKLKIYPKKIKDTYRGRCLTQRNFTTGKEIRTGAKSMKMKTDFNIDPMGF
jgi:hypothetical protein